MSSQRIALTSAVALAAVSLATLPGTAGARTGERCFDASIREHKTSLGVHQWTVRLETHWCSALRDDRWELVEVQRRASVRTGTNWKVISKRVTNDGGLRTATVTADYHLRLRYPWFEQNCYPVLEIRMNARGESRESRETGC
jgi:hypothetical protein